MSSLSTTDHEASRASPPAGLRQLYKSYQLMKSDALQGDRHIVDFASVSNSQREKTGWRASYISSEQVQNICKAFHSFEGPIYYKDGSFPSSRTSLFAYESAYLPGLRIFPSLLPPRTQLCLLSRLMHRDLSIASHRTNAHLHHEVLPPQTQDHDKPGDEGSGKEKLNFNSFFDRSPSSPVSFRPKDPLIHPPLKISRFLARKLRWLTIGGQYDWTRKAYPTEAPPPFPRDIAMLMEGLFPDTKPQAAIVNLYSPGDTLSLHRDVSEDCENGLISVSLGCDGILVIGLDELYEDGREPPSPTVESMVDRKCIVLRLHSGDVLYMSGKARFAWHGVPKILPETCPEWMRDWPAENLANFESENERDDRFNEWRGWMATKRINLNVRQMA